MSWLFTFIPVFVGLWLLVSAAVGFSSGWFNLQQWYPDDGSEEPLLTLPRQSGAMSSRTGPLSAGLSMNRILTLSACRTGLSVRIWRLFAPFQRPLLIPWSEIRAEPVTTFFVPFVRLRFGDPAMGWLKIRPEAWSKLASAAAPIVGGAMPAALPDRSEATVRGMVIRWLLMTTIAAPVVYLVSRSVPGGEGFPLIACVALPAAVFGAQILAVRAPPW